MSTASPVLPDPKVAFDTLFNQVHTRAFFTKLASFGFSPANEKEASDMLELAGKLRVVAQEPQVKAAQAHNPYAQANAALDNVLKAHGLDGGVKTAAAQERDVAVRGIASQLAQDPGLYNAVLSMKAAEAAQLSEQLNAA